jgi:carnitine-CoA ligase
MTSAAIPAWEAAKPATETVVTVLREAASECPDGIFLDFSGETYTYSQVWERAQAVARGFRQLGVAPGHTVVTMLDNNIDGVTCWFAANLLQAIWVPINTALRGEFLSHIVRDTATRIVVCEPDLAERFGLVEQSLPELKLLLIRDSTSTPDRLSVRCEPLDLHRIADGRDEWPDPRPEDTTCLIYTGGTTGPSKGGIVSHAYIANVARRYNEATGRTTRDITWSPLPMFHLNLISLSIMATMMIKGTASIFPRFSVSKFWPEIQRVRPAIVNLVGAMPAMIARMPDTAEMIQCKGAVRVLYAAPVAPDDQVIWRDRFGVGRPGAHAYGLGEAFPITMLPPGEPAPLGSSGKPNEADFDVRIFDDADRELAAGEVGEVVVRPRRPGVMFDGYWRRPDTTVAMTRNLWYHTGDLGRFDADGFFYFVDRKKDYLRRRGENISSQEQESIYLSHPDIHEVAVHAVLSEHAEDDVKVTAVRVEGSTLTEAELFEWARERVPYYALPRYIEFRETLPRSVLNRILKYRLRDEGFTPQTWDRERENVTWDRR